MRLLHRCKLLGHAVEIARGVSQIVGALNIDLVAEVARCYFVTGGIQLVQAAGQQGAQQQ